MNIPFNIPITSMESAENVKYLAANPLYISQKYFTKQCEKWFQNIYPDYNAILTTSCTKAMELIALSINIQEGDEVVMPSFTYVGVANSFANLGAKIVFVDIEPETMNINTSAIQEVITKKTKCIILMHYGGVACDLSSIVDLCKQNHIVLIEDNAQGLGAKYNDKYLGQFGDFSCISFDTQKTISCGEGGVLLFKKEYKDAVTTCFENGTNREDFSKGIVRSYEWINRGSKFSISDYNAAVLLPLLMDSENIISKRKSVWSTMYQAIFHEESIRHLLTPKLQSYDHNGHIFFLKCSNKEERDELSFYLNSKEIACSFHFSPLHFSPRSKKADFELKKDIYTTSESDKLLRLPVFNDLGVSSIQYIVCCLKEYFSKK